MQPHMDTTASGTSPASWGLGPQPTPHLTNTMCYHACSTDTEVIGSKVTLKMPTGLVFAQKGAGAPGGYWLAAPVHRGSYLLVVVGACISSPSAHQLAACIHRRWTIMGVVQRAQQEVPMCIPYAQNACWCHNVIIGS